MHLLNYIKKGISFAFPKGAHWLAFLIVLLDAISNAQSHPDGAPTRLCETMLPSHGEQSIGSNMPYEISIDRRFIRGNGRLTITVTSKDPSKYTLMGILFVMKPFNDKKQAVGTFDPTRSKNDLKTIACFGKEGSGITHFNSNAKSILMFQWIAPNTTSGDYELHATLVRNYNQFWADYIYREKILVRVDAPASAGFTFLFKPLLLAALITSILSRDALLYYDTTNVFLF